MKIPKKIRIGSKEYRIRKKRLMPKDVGGHINYISNNIRILKTDDKRDEEDIFFHEVSRGIMRELEFN